MNTLRADRGVAGAQELTVDSWVAHEEPEVVQAEIRRIETARRVAQDLQMGYEERGLGAAIVQQARRGAVYEAFWAAQRRESGVEEVLVDATGYTAYVYSLGHNQILGPDQSVDESLSVSENLVFWARPTTDSHHWEYLRHPDGSRNVFVCNADLYDARLPVPEDYSQRRVDSGSPYVHIYRAGCQEYMMPRLGENGEVVGITRILEHNDAETPPAPGFGVAM